MKVHFMAKDMPSVYVAHMYWIWRNKTELPGGIASGGMFDRISQKLLGYLYFI